MFYISKISKRVIAILITVIFSIMFGILIYVNTVREHNMDSLDSNIQKEYSRTSNSFYYSQLTEEEKVVCEKIRELFNTYKGGFIELEHPISHLSFSRIVQTLTYDDEYGFWPFVQAIPVSEEGEIKSINTLVWQEETNTEDISGIYIQLLEKEKRDSLRNFSFDISNNYVLKNSSELLNLLETTQFDENYYNKISTEIKEKEYDIINKIPLNSNQKEIVRYFSDWMARNMKYDYNIEKKMSTITTYDELLEYQLDYVDVSREQCVLKKEAICGGFATLLSKLCNEVGIESYVVSGEMSFSGKKQYHIWTAVVIDGNKYYTDPTYTVSTGNISDLYTKEELINNKPHGIIYKFSNYFKYD